MKAPGPKLHLFLASVLFLFAAFAVRAVVPEYSVANGVVRIKGVGPDNLIIYDNDFWTDVPDAAYLWAKASLGEAKLVGNVITRCTFGWEKNTRTSSSSRPMRRQSFCAWPVTAG